LDGPNKVGEWEDSKVPESIKPVDAHLAASSECGSGAFVVLR
jgi:hypothetical protein